MFRQPSLEKNPLHEYLDNEDAAASGYTNTAATASRGGVYEATGAGFGAEEGAGGRMASNENGQGEEEEEEEDQEMGVRCKVFRSILLVLSNEHGNLW